VVGINSDYTDDQDTPGPSCSLNGVLHPVFFIRTVFDSWLGTSTIEDARAAGGGGHGNVVDNPPVTRAFSVEEVIERTGLSKTRLYEEIARKNLRARKSGVRTLILENDLDRFLRQLPAA
jgi:excisionase family DNA binding protein